MDDASEEASLIVVGAPDEEMSEVKKGVSFDLHDEVVGTDPLFPDGGGSPGDHQTKANTRETAFSDAQESEVYPDFADEPISPSHMESARPPETVTGGIDGPTHPSETTEAARTFQASSSPPTS